MIKGTTAASSVVITPAAAMEIRKSLMKNGRKRRILRPALNLVPLKDDGDTSVRNRKIPEKTEDKMKAIKDEVKSERRRKTYSPRHRVAGTVSSFTPGEAIKKLVSVKDAFKREGDGFPAEPGEAGEIALTRAERIAKRAVPPRPPLVVRKETQVEDPEGNKVVLRPLGTRGSSTDLGRKKLGQASSDDEGAAVARPRLMNNVQYKYKLYSGNNSLLVLQAMRKRTWLHPARDDLIDYAKQKKDCGQGESQGEGGDGGGGAPTLEIEMIWEQYRHAKRYKSSLYKDCVLNHIQGNLALVTKKGLYFSIRNYCAKNNLDLADIVPRSFYLHCNGKDPSEFGEGRDDDTAAFKEYNRTAQGLEAEADGGGRGQGIVWICKPASLTNRGYGIVVLNGERPVLDLVNRALTASPRPTASEEQEGKPSVEARKKRSASKSGLKEGYIVQEYMTRPLLVSGRKFDIRCFVLLHLDRSKGADKKLHAYFHKEMYVRTSGKKYSLDDLSDRECHLTNDAVQMKCATYGKYESGNKLTMTAWQEQIERDYPDAPARVVHDSIIPRIKELTSISLSAALAKLEKTCVNKSFELLGYDYMVTDDFRPLLIEVNSNPCLELSCPLLGHMIPLVVNNAFKVSVDKLLPPPPPGCRTKNCESSVQAVENESDLFEELPIYR